MSHILDVFISRLMDEELEKCFLEIYEHRRSGEWPSNCTVKKLWYQFKSESKLDIFPIRTMIEAFLFEIAIRKHREDGIEV